MMGMSQKTAFIVAGLLCASVVIAGCGRKPSFNDLKASSSSTDTNLEIAPPTEKVDGSDDDKLDVAKEKPKKGFFLDFLL